MNILIEHNAALTKQEKQQIKAEWDALDLRDDTRIIGLDWEERDIYTVARIDDELAGYIHIKSKAGVGVISSVLVFAKYSGNKIGTQVIKKCLESISKNNIHKLTKITRTIYPDYRIFIENGFEKVSDLKNHFGKEDYVLLSKNVN